VVRVGRLHRRPQASGHNPLAVFEFFAHLVTKITLTFNIYCIPIHTDTSILYCAEPPGKCTNSAANDGCPNNLSLRLARQSIHAMKPIVEKFASLLLRKRQ